MENPFDDLNKKMDQVLIYNKKLLSIVERGGSTSDLIPFSQFCEERGITRQTGYNWMAKRLFKTKKIDGIRYVLSDSVRVVNKFQREPLTA